MTSLTASWVQILEKSIWGQREHILLWIDPYLPTDQPDEGLEQGCSDDGFLSCLQILSCAFWLEHLPMPVVTWTASSSGPTIYFNMLGDPIRTNRYNILGKCSRILVGVSSTSTSATDRWSVHKRCRPHQRKTWMEWHQWPMLLRSGIRLGRAKDVDRKLTRVTWSLQGQHPRWNSMRLALIQALSTRSLDLTMYLLLQGSASSSSPYHLRSTCALSQRREVHTCMKRGIKDGSWK